MASSMKEFEHVEIQLEVIKLATNNFDEKNVIGHGGFGKVYKGELSHYHSEGNSMVALKRLDRRGGQGDAEFYKEVRMLSCYRHENIISLLGFSRGRDEMILVYEYASRGSLDGYLKDVNLTWTQRLKICLDAAKGLSYLHDPRQTYQRLIHCDIKSANILLDENFNAKVADFGLSKIGPANQQNSFLVTDILGTFGYCDPVFMETYTLTKESDVYSFGVVLFEVLCGRLCIAHNNGQHIVYVPFWKKKYKENKLNDIILKDLMQQMDMSSLKTFAGIAYLCLERSREERPVMSLVVEKLEKSLRLQKLYDIKLRRSEEIFKSANPPLRYRSIKEFNAILSKGFLFSGGKKGRQQFAPSVYCNSTGGRHFEPNFDVSKYTHESDHGERSSLMLNGQTTQSSDNTSQQNFASGPVRANSRFEDPANDNYFQPSPMNDRVDSYALEEDGPGIDGFQIIGDGKPGGKLLGCGFPVRGTSVCMFQWVRLLEDGTREYIDGATSPEYVVTADDVNKLIGVECIPMDEQGRQGKMVLRFANKQNKTTCEDGPGIGGFQIIGDAKPGGKLLGCGFPVRGTSLCMFQWVRLHQDGTREYIVGATNAEYVVSADDVDKLIALECIPMDDQGRQGELVRLFANKQNKITCDPKMQQEVDNYMSAGQASFSVLLLMDSSENWEQTTLTLGRSKYQIRINRTQEIVIDEKYSSDLSIKIPSGLTTQFVLIRPNGSSHPFNTFNDVRMRDTLVLTMRMFQSMEGPTWEPGVARVTPDFKSRSVNFFIKYVFSGHVQPPILPNKFFIGQL